MICLYAISMEFASAGVTEGCRVYAATLRDLSENAIEIGDALRAEVQAVCRGSITLSSCEWGALNGRLESGVCERAIVNQVLWRPEDAVRVADALTIALGGDSQSTGLAGWFRSWRRRVAEATGDGPDLSRLRSWLEVEAQEGRLYRSPCEMTGRQGRRTWTGYAPQPWRVLPHPHHVDCIDEAGLPVHHSRLDRGIHQLPRPELPLQLLQALRHRTEHAPSGSGMDIRGLQGLGWSGDAYAPGELGTPEAGPAPRPTPSKAAARTCNATSSLNASWVCWTDRRPLSGARRPRWVPQAPLSEDGFS